MSAASSRPRLHTALWAILLGVVLVACTQRSEFPGTYVVYDDETCAFVIHLNMAFHGDGASQAQVDRWTRAINDFWNGKDMKVGACPLRVEATSTMVRSAADCPPERHCIEVEDIAAGTSHTSHVNLPPGSTNGDGNPNGWQTTDRWTGMPTVHAEWDNQDIDQVAVHESAHLLGLDDEYREGDVACGVANCVTQVAWGEMVVPQTHVDALARAADLRCPCSPTPTPTPVVATPAPTETAPPTTAPTEVAAGIEVQIIDFGGYRVLASSVHLAEADACDSQHWHGTGRGIDPPYQLYADPNPPECGHGKFPEFQAEAITLTEEEAGAFTLATNMPLQ